MLAGVLDEGVAGGAGAPKRMRKKLKRLSVGAPPDSPPCRCATR